MLPKELD